MKKIKLAALALALVCGGIGAYGKAKSKMSTFYYIVAGTSYSAPNFMIASSSPALNCYSGQLGYVCTVLAEDNLMVGYPIPSQDAIIVYIYE